MGHVVTRPSPPANWVTVRSIWPALIHFRDSVQAEAWIILLEGRIIFAKTFGDLGPIILCMLPQSIIFLTDFVNALFSCQPSLTFLR